MSEMDTTRISTFTLFLAAALVLGGCFETLNGPYEGEDQIGFAFELVAQAHDEGEPAEATVPSDTTIALTTELIGPQRSSDVEVAYGTVDETVDYVREVPTDTGQAREETIILAHPTTAEEGVHYNISGSYTLPADSSSADLTVQILDGLAPDDDPVRLALRLDGNPEQNLLPAERMRYYTLTIQPPNP